MLTVTGNFRLLGGVHPPPPLSRSLNVDKESSEDNSELKDKKSAVRAARHYLDTVVNQINILAEKNQLNKDGRTNSNEDT